MHKYIGTPVSRVDGRAKVTGKAKYAAEYDAPDLAYGSVVTAPIAKGRIKRIDTRKARQVPGVIDVITHKNRPKMARSKSAYGDEVAPPKGSPFRPLYDDKIRFNGQPVALVIAEEAEIARFAADLVHVDYEKEEHVTDMSDGDCETVTLKPTTKQPEGQFTPPASRGKAEKAYNTSPVRHAGDYSVPIEHHNPMELFATTVVRDSDGRLTIYDKTQGVQNVGRYVSAVFDLPPDKIRVMSPYMGGGFGSGLRPQIPLVLAVLGALATDRSVRVVLTRQQMYIIGYRPAMKQRIEIGATSEGHLNAISHNATTITSQYEDFYRQETGWSGLLYKCNNARYAHDLARLDLPTACDMRAPSAATGVFALECAMDELATSLELDPLELRLRCYSDVDQHTGHPYSSKALRACYQQGAETFGWSRRAAKPRATHDGKDLVGWGMATGIWEALQVPITVRIVLSANGHAEVSCAASDLGTGTYTIMAQVAADALGLPIDDITIKLGDSTLPQCSVSGGSWTAASVSNGIANTADAIRTELLHLAQKMPHSPLANTNPEDVVLSDGKLIDKHHHGHGVSILSAMRAGGRDRIKQEKTTTFSNGKTAHNTHSAVFAEVKVDEDLGIIRVTRVVSAVAAGRILNTKTAQSQIMGGVVWGIGMALHEETLIDHTFGRVMNANIAEYHVPVNADVHDIDVIFVDEPDPKINGMGIKGVGEIGIVGVPAAIANAVYHATGKRVRDLPITLDKLMR